MPLPHKISTLLYCFNERDEVLLIERAQEPNLGCWSPPGGKLITADGESPHACALREANEEMGLVSEPTDWRLTGMVSEASSGDYFVVKNSWGEANACGGYLYASEAFFAYKTICIMVHKDALSKALQRELGL